MTPLFLGRFPYVTMSMEQLQVVSRLFPTLACGKDVLDLDQVLIGEVQPTGPTYALLLFQEPGYLWFYLRMASQSCTPIDPVAVI
jgi:hypothetical protein